ncbi:MAG: hypothetical protein GMKNLPBB_01585 [Myxococcota bacterium]|nr:hypothetical protein [Myxococcota bacterium]
MKLPGAPAFDPALIERLWASFRAKGKDYVPRTHHLTGDGQPRYINRLIEESSPYLLQHAHNPVNWRPWGDDAFAEAAARDVPVLLSVGYSTCHWCHVMEEESFENEQIAARMNELFVCVKVDREERPDVDSLHMTAVQMMTGHGGWPMTVLLTPDRKPWFAGTYFPPFDGSRGARMGFYSMLQVLHEAWKNQRGEVLEQGEEVSRRLRELGQPDPSRGLPGPDRLDVFLQTCRRQFDPSEGGFGGAPKFPRPAVLDLLIRLTANGPESDRRMVTLTLDKMAAGGMYDHIGGGFHRYSVDDIWLVPHFEKMLYDNAQLARAYLEGWKLTGAGRYAITVREILEYIQREMTAPDSGFWSATDADSEGEEGLFFLWTPDEVKALIPEDHAARICAWFDITEAGNFEGRNIARTRKSVESAAARFGDSPQAFLEIIASAKQKMYEARLKRVPPLRDDKIITAWNGLMISAFACAGFAFQRMDWQDAAAAAMRAILAHPAGGAKLARTRKDGVAKTPGYLDDYAFSIEALLWLFETTGDPAWMEHALNLQQEQDELFLDRERGGYFHSGSRHEQLITREKEAYDGAEPSGNSVAAMNLMRLSVLTGRHDFRERAEAVVRAFGKHLESNPFASPLLLAALRWMRRDIQHVIIAGQGPRVDALMQVIRTGFWPDVVLTPLPDGVTPRLAEQVPAVQGRGDGGEPRAFVCIAGECKLPVEDPVELRKLLEAGRG